MVRSSLHAIAAGTSANLGGATDVDGESDSPSISASLTSEGYSAELACSGSRNASFAMFTTNSPVASILRAVSFSTPARSVMLMPIMGGLVDRNVKALNGARFTVPLREHVV